VIATTSVKVASSLLDCAVRRYHEAAASRPSCVSARAARYKIVGIVRLQLAHEDPR
jgi:hypothetical protein